jgi:Domain of unknown function (DUF4062)
VAYRAFVSSTFKDLRRHREVAIATLRRSGFTVDPMEDWPAATQAPSGFSQERIDGCDLCILLLARRRGHVPKGRRKSITQLEYEEAVRQGIDVLVYLLADEARWPAEFDELRPTRLSAAGAPRCSRRGESSGSEPIPAPSTSVLRFCAG